MKNRGVLECAFGFSLLFFLSSCATSNSGSNSFSKDKFNGELKIQRQFGKFINANAISIDAFGNVYVVDEGAPGVYKFNTSGDSIRGVIALGKEHNQFDEPKDIDASLTNAVAIADRNNHRIEIYSKDLIWQATIPGHNVGSKIQFGYPLAVRTSSAGNYYIIDGENKRALSIQPENNSQQVISLSGTTTGVELNPVSLALAGNEFVTIADANSRSLIIFNNAYLPQSRIRYAEINSIKLSSSENHIYAFDKNSNIIRVFDANDLSYKSSLAMPSGANHAVAIFAYKGEYYILTKEKVIVCSKE